MLRGIFLGFTKNIAESLYPLKLIQPEQGDERTQVRTRFPVTLRGKSDESFCSIITS